MGDEIEKNEMGWACSLYGGKRRVYRVLVGRPEGRSPFGIRRHRWDDNIKKDIQVVGIDWIELAQDRDRWHAFVNVLMNFQFRKM